MTVHYEVLQTSHNSNVSFRFPFIHIYSAPLASGTTGNATYFLRVFDAWIVIVVCSTKVPPIFEYDLFGPSVAATLLLKPYLLLR
jgi:hypothetical protein